jgi:hypothetical protein
MSWLRAGPLRPRVGRRRIGSESFARFPRRGSVVLVLLGLWLVVLAVVVEECEFQQSG